MHETPRYPALLALLALVACNGGDETSRGSDGATSTTAATATTTATTAMTSAASSGGETASASESGTSAATTSTSAATTSSSGEGTSTTDGATTDGTTTAAMTSAATTSTSDASSSGTTGDTEGMTCDLEQVKDTLNFSYLKQFDTGIPDMVLQASYYNGAADEVMIMSFSGKARRFDLDGNPLSDVFDVPAEALPKLDGATYDPVLGRGLLINQDCKLVEVEPVTLGVIESKQLGFGMSICAGLTLGLDNNLYVASYGTNELVVLSRDGLTEIRRIDMIAKVQLNGLDGVALIAGSENFLVMSTSPKAEAAIIDGFGNVLVAKSALGQALPPLTGGMPSLPDAVLTICGNGHAWLCEAYNATCFDYAPEDGDKDACPCLIPQ